jgi:hypothetical protein
VLNNSDGRFSLGSTVYGQPISLTHRVRISASWGGWTWPLFTGYVQDWDPDGGTDWSVVKVGLVDAFGLFARDEANVDLTPEFGVLNSNVAIKQVLDSISFPRANTYMTGIGSVSPASYVKANPLTIMQDIAAAEDGTFFVEYDGYIVLHSRYYRLQVQNAPFTTFSDYAPEGFRSYVEADLKQNDQFLANDVRVTSQVTGNVQQVVDGASIIRHRRRKLERNVPLGDNDALALAQWNLYHYNVPTQRFDSITLNGELDNSLWYDIVRRLIDERLRIRKRVGGGVVEKDGWIAGIQHTIARDSWITKWMLIPADSGSLFFTLNSATSGVLDQNVLGY